MVRCAIHNVAVACAGIVLSASPALAQSSFSIDPLLIRFEGNNRNAVMTITNSSLKDLRFEIKAYAWDQTPPDGEMQLTPTSDVVVFPPLVTMKPRAIQRVRIGTTAAQGPIEKSYRVMFEELPSGAAPEGAATVAVRTKVGVPVFLEPAKPTVRDRIESVRFTRRTVEVVLQNTGTAHTMIDSVIVRGMGGPDEALFEEPLHGWYLLAGKTRVWQYELRSAQCRGLKFVEVEVYDDEELLTSRADLPAGACTP